MVERLTPKKGKMDEIMSHRVGVPPKGQRDPKPDRLDQDQETMKDEEQDKKPVVG